MNIVIKIKHHLDMFFFPFLTCYGFEDFKNIQWINWNKILKGFISIIWVLFFSFLCVLMNQLHKRNGEVKEQNKTTKTIVDFGLSFFLITTILFMILILVNSYIIWVFSDTNKPTQIIQGLSVVVFFIFFIYYCKFMNAYYNPSIEKKEETEEKENIQYIYNKDKNNGTLIFSGLLLTCLCLFFIFNFPFFPLIKKWKGYRNFISDFFQLNIGSKGNKNIMGSYLSIRPTGGGCTII